MEDGGKVRAKLPFVTEYSALGKIGALSLKATTSGALEIEWSKCNSREGRDSNG